MSDARQIEHAWRCPCRLRECCYRRDGKRCEDRATFLFYTIIVDGKGGHRRFRCSRHRMYGYDGGPITDSMCTCGAPHSQ